MHIVCGSHMTCMNIPIFHMFHAWNVHRTRNMHAHCMWYIHASNMHGKAFRNVLKHACFMRVSRTLWGDLSLQYKGVLLG